MHDLKLAADILPLPNKVNPMHNQFEPIAALEGAKTALKCKKFSFFGFGQALSHCSLLLILTLDDRRIVVCSQPSGRYSGTSVTNGFELIFEKLRASGSSQSWLRRTRSPGDVSQWAKWEQGKTFWLEHYPAGVSALVSRYTLMSVSLHSGHPSWGPNTTWEEMAVRLQLPVATLAYGYESDLNCA